MKRDYRQIAILILALAGLIMSTYLTRLKLENNIYSCGLGECGIVQSSEYAEFFGIPVAAFGAGFYGLLFVLVASNLPKFARGWALFGLAFSMYLTALELFVIKALCGWCVISFAIVILINLLIFKDE